MLYKDILQTLSHSWGRFISIVCLMALGSFALVGLWVTGPDMQITGADYYRTHNLADITVLSDYGLSEDDQQVIKQVKGIKDVEFGYFKDVTVKNTDRAVRIYSAPERVSTYELRQGRLPRNDSEIALGETLNDKFAIGSTIRFTEKPDIAGDTVLSVHEYQVVGFVRASDTVSDLNMGQSTAGSGVLNDYAVVDQSAFDSDVAMIAKLTFSDTQGLNYWSDDYRDAVQTHKSALTAHLAGQPDKRVNDIREQRREQIDKAKQQVAEAKQQLVDTEQQLADAKAQIENAKDQLARGKIDAVNQAGDAAGDAVAGLNNTSQQAKQAAAGIEQLVDAQSQIAFAGTQLTQASMQLNAAGQQIAQGNAQLSQAWAQLVAAKTQLDQARVQLETAELVLDAIDAKLNQWESTGLTGPIYNKLREQYEQAYTLYNQAVDQYNSKLADYNKALEQWNVSAGQLEAGSKEYQENAAMIADAANQLAAKQTELGRAMSKSINAASTSLPDAADASDAGRLSDGVEQLIEAERSIEQAQEEYQSKLDEFNEAKPAAEKKIAAAEKDIALAQEKVDGLIVPAYSVNSRREGLTAEGYRVYMIIANIVAKLARVFPIFLYLVASLVTFTTMGRMVDEERVNSGTLKALGYSNIDVMKKFVIYGFTASTAGTIIGVALGHTLLPYIVYHAYSSGFTLPLIAMDFHPGITVAAFILAWVSAVVPTLLIVSRELREKPAALLLPKPPAKGSKIFLERIMPLWDRLNFTRKVTVRNIVRYKIRLFMTVFGVAGAVCLLMAGLGVQGSIDQIGDRQFGDLIHYDLIVAERSDNNDEQRQEIETALQDKAVESSTPVTYEEMTWTGGKSGDKQSMTLLASDDAYNFSDYMTLRDRQSHDPQVLSDTGAVVSERLADMLGVDVGDSFSVYDASGERRTITVSGVSEMYIGHFIFMSSGGYEHVFGKDWAANAYMVRLNDHSSGNAAEQGARLMELSGVKSVVQNITQRKMINTIVSSLNQIMEVLVLVAALLAVVILYNLTNLNVSERIRELSTIKVLGFHTNETTMYIYRETIVESAIGILCGYVFGALLHGYIINEVPPDEVMFDPSITWRAFIVPVIVVGVVLAVLGWVVYRRLKTVDMLAALKSVE
nr:FtsX-like permease family protein [Bifidobacterium sp. DSM 109957]